MRKKAVVAKAMYAIWLEAAEHSSSYRALLATPDALKAESAPLIYEPWMAYAYQYMRAGLAAWRRWVRFMCRRPNHLALNRFAPDPITLGMHFRDCRRGGPTAAYRVYEGLKWFAAQLGLDMPLKLKLVIEQAAVPGDHIEKQAPTLTLPDTASMELMALRLHKEGLRVSVHIALTVILQSEAVLRQRHMCRAILIRMLDNDGAEGKVGAGKRRAHGRQRAFIFTIAKDGMLIQGIAAMFFASWSLLKLPNGKPLPYLCPRYTGAFGTPSCHFHYDHAMYLAQHLSLIHI